MKTYIINLESSTRRRANILDEVRRHGLDHEIVQAVDGRAMSPETLERLPLTDELRSNTYYSPTVIGAALSHVRVYEKMLESGAEVALVLEDDAMLCDGFSKVIDGVQSRIAANEIVLCHYMSSNRIELSDVRSVSVTDGYSMYYPIALSDMASGAAYVITRAAAESMLATVVPIRCEADSWELFCELGGFGSIRFVHPMPVTVRGDKSTIAVSGQSGLRKWLTSRIDDYRLPPFYQMLRAARIRSIARRSRVVVLPDQPMSFAGNAEYEERDY